MKKIKRSLLSIFLLILSMGILNAEDENTLTNEETKEKIVGIEQLEEIEYKKNIKMNKIFNIDLNILKNTLEEKYNSDILFEWNIAGENTQNGSVFEKQFEEQGDYEINLSIYKLSGNEQELITNKKLNIFVYTDKIVQVFDESLGEKINDFELKLKTNGIYINKIIINKEDIEKTNFKDEILKEINESQYLVVWGGKDFIFDSLSKINSENFNTNLNLVLISSFNIDILQKYLGNFTSNKGWIKEAILIDESSRFEIIKQTKTIEELKIEMSKNNYEYISLNSNNEISEVLFISKFINNLSNRGFSTINIYLILIIPFLLMGVIVFKHLIGLGVAGILIPTTITLLFIKLSFLPTITLIIIFLVTNLVISKFISRYNLHYSPRITLITIINIIVTIITTNIFISYNIISVDINDIMFIIFFILISEKLINIIVSKDFSEYKLSLLNTLVFSIISYMFFSLEITKSFILSYPEIILVFIPIAFIIGRFTGLRVTEYFRFREVIKSIEEEE